MAEIKSAYEKAMERFQEVEPDNKSLLQKETMDNGRLLCAQKLRGEAVDIQKSLNSKDGEEKKWLKEGLGTTLLAQITLPKNELPIDQIDNLKEIVLSISSQTEPEIVEEILSQYKQLCQQYLDSKIELSENMKTQYMQMIQQQGQQQSSAMETSFIQNLQKQIKSLDSQYLPAVQQTKQNLSQICGISLE